MATPKRTRRTDGSVPCKCLICEKKFVNRKALVDHIEKMHGSQIPKEWSASRYENYLRTGKTEGKCVICGKPTPWNPATEKYGRMCGGEACRKIARERASKNYIGLHGKPYTINDPEQQKKMIYSRKNAGKYVFEDETTGKKYEAMYDSSYGLGFFEMLDTFLFWPGSDIMAPSPHIYYYEYEGEKHFYIPDAYIYSLNAEIELKDGGTNPNTHPKILAVDKVKEKLKDDVMKSLAGQVNYIKICDKNYAEFFAMLSELKGQDTSIPKWTPKLSHVTESYIPSDANYGEMFNSYYLHPHKVDNPGVDEECFSKTLDDEIKNALSNCASDGKGDKIFYVYTMGTDFYHTYRCVLLGAIHVYWYDKWEPGCPPKYDYEWDYQEEVRVEDCNDLQGDVVHEAAYPIIPKLNLLQRSELLTNPVLNYDALLEYYKKLLFHKRLNKKEWAELYNELQKVRDSLKATINGSSENDKRLNYEAKTALAEVERFIAYMETENSVKESIDIFTSGDFSEYAKYADLDSAKKDVPINRLEPKSLTDYQKMPITVDIIQEYGDICPDLKRNKADTTGYIWIDPMSNNVVGFVRARKHEWMTWLADIKVEAGYQGRSLGDQMMGVAKRDLGVHYLTVSNNNTAAINLFRKHGFGMYDSTDWCSHMTDLQKITLETTTPMMMEGVASCINPDFTKGEQYSLRQYKSIPISKETIDRYKDRYPTLKHVRVTDSGQIYLDGSDVVAIFGAGPHRDTTDPSETWIYSFEVMPNYRGHGLSRQILDVAIKDYNVKYLSVAKNNQIARRLYKEMGFVDYGENRDMWFMKLKGSKTPKFADISTTSHSITENALPRETELVDIIEFNKATNNMEYIVPNGGNIITEISEDDYYKFYKLLSPEEFEKYNGGVCWDYVLYEAKYFDKFFPDIPYKTFYFCSERGNSHTFLIFELDGMYYWYESSWKSQVGIYGFRTERDAVDYVTNLLLNDLTRRENNGIPMRGYIIEYNVDEIKVGVRCMAYMNHMIKKIDKIGDRRCLVRKRTVRPIRTIRGRITYESTIGLMPAFQVSSLMESFKGDDDISFGKSELDVLDIIKTMTPTEQLYLGTPGGRQYRWSRSEFYQEVLYVNDIPVGFLVVSEIPATKGVGHIIIGVRSGKQYRHKGYASMLIARFINSDKIPSHITSLEWGFDDGNVKSEHLAAKFGFSNPTVSEDQVHHRGYVMTQKIDDIKPLVNKEVIRKSLIREENWYQSLESTYIEASKNDQLYFPVFIFLSYTGTRMAQLIKSFTHDPYAHSSMSFNTTLEDMISFNRDGMVVENIQTGIWKKNAKQIKYSLYMYMATAQEYDAMKRFVDELLTRKNKLKYNMLGLTNFIFGRGSEREDKFFCSEFVASVISAGNSTLLKQSPHMTTPYNLAKNKNFIFIKKGILSHYDQTVVDKIIAEKLEEGGFGNVTIE